MQGGNVVIGNAVERLHRHGQGRDILQKKRWPRVWAIRLEKISALAYAIEVRKVEVAERVALLIGDVTRRPGVRAHAACREYRRDVRVEIGRGLRLLDRTRQRHERDRREREHRERGEVRAGAQSHSPSSVDHPAA